jgi:hypothetical protein
MSAISEVPFGLRYDLSNEDYHAGPGISNSGLSEIARSPAFFYGMRLDPNRPPSTEKAGQFEGTLCHCATLEPAQFDERYVVLPSDAPTRPSSRQWNAKNPSAESLAAMRWWTTFEADNSGRRVVTQAQYDTAHAQAEKLRALPEVAALLAAGRAEVSAYWTDAKTGELCRCRPDWVHPIGERRVILLDVKTYSDASPIEFARQVARKGYHRQDAWYSDGYAIASNDEVMGFVFAAVEDKWPYGACACILDDAGREKGRSMNRDLLDKYAECKRTGIWPGYSSGIEMISLPRWAA